MAQKNKRGVKDGGHMVLNGEIQECFKKVFVSSTKIMIHLGALANYNFEGKVNAVLKCLAIKTREQNKSNNK